MKHIKKLIKTYESFVVDKNFKFEPVIIDPILECIKEHQVYLTEKENLPQLAKLGYMYNTLWYAGRACWGYDGILRGQKLMSQDEDGEEYAYGDCEDNPKYKIEMCDPQDDEIEDLIYDAWGMHVSNDFNQITYDDFKNLILNGKELTEFEKKERKPNKTFEEWVDILTDKRYQYSSLYPDRRSVANYLLCTIGTGYGFSKDGFIIKEASGADQDEDIYGFWENAKFLPEIQSVVDKILSMPELKYTLDGFYEYVKSINEKRKSEKRKELKMFYDILKKAGKYKDEEGDLDQSEIFDRMDDIRDIKKSGITFGKSKKEVKYSPYYPISSSSIISKLCDPEAKKREGITNIDPSYINASKEVLLDILAHSEIEDSQHHKTNNTKYAKKFLGYLGVEGFKVEKGIDKYLIFDDIKLYFRNITDDLHESTPSTDMYGKDTYSITMNDTAVSSYGDNNYYCSFNWSVGRSAQFPRGMSNDVEFIKSSPVYDDFKVAIDRMKSKPEIKQILFYFRNSIPLYSGDPSGARISMEIHTNPSTAKYAKECLEDEELLKKEGFDLDKNTLLLHLDKLGINLSIRKPKPLGQSHTPGREYFSNALSMDIYDKNKCIFSLAIDERKFNTCYCSSQPSDPKDKKILDWMLGEFEKLKLSDPGYGSYDSKTRKGSDGSKCLYAHYFMLWLKDHQNEYKS